MELKKQSFVYFLKINLHFIITQIFHVFPPATAHISPALKLSKEFQKIPTDFIGFWTMMRLLWKLYELYWTG